MDSNLHFQTHMKWAIEQLKAAGVYPYCGFILWFMYGHHNRLSWKHRRMLGRKIRRGDLLKPPGQLPIEVWRKVQAEHQTVGAPVVD